MRTSALILALSLAAPAAAPAQAPARGPVSEHPRVSEALAVVETWLEAMRAYERIPGVSAAIVHDQERVWSGAYGLAHPDEGVAAEPGTLYSICSISKLFTSVALMQLRDEGLLELSDPVAEHLPWYAVTQAHEASAPVTVEGLLTHASGLPRESDHPYWSGPDFPFPTREEVIDGLKNQETIYPAWTYFQYSNLGLTLAGELVRELSGMPYDAYVRANVLEPLGLDATYPEMPEEHRGGRLAQGYAALDREGERAPTPFYQARGIAPAAGYASTVEDLGSFASWQFRTAGRPAPEEIEVLHPRTLEEMQRVHWIDPSWETHWGLGFSVNRRDGETFVGHGGSCPGYRSQLVLQMDDRVATVFMANASGVNTGKYAYGMYDLVAPALREAAGEEDAEDVAATSAAAPATDGGSGSSDPSAQEAPELDRYLGTYDAQPWGGEVAVVRWKGELAALGLPTDDPAEALQPLRHVEGHTFRRVRDDGELGEAVVFEVDERGQAVAFRQWTNIHPRIRP